MDNMDIKIILLSFHKKTMNSQTLITFTFLLQSVSHNYRKRWKFEIQLVVRGQRSTLLFWYHIIIISLKSHNLHFSSGKSFLNKTSIYYLIEIKCCLLHSACQSSNEIFTAPVNKISTNTDGDPRSSVYSWSTPGSASINTSGNLLAHMSPNPSEVKP